MKKLMTLIIAVGLLLGSVMGASAAEITVNGSFDFMWGWIDNGDSFASWQDEKAASATDTFHTVGAGGIANGTEDQFRAVQRERIQVNFTASENVRGVLYFEMGEASWGQPNHGAQIGTDGIVIELRRAFITFNVPNTDLVFQPGLQGVALPSAVAGSPVLDADMAALVSTYKINDMVTIGAVWGRPWDINTYNDNVAGSINDEIDVFALFVPITIDGMATITPYAAYGIVGTDALYGQNPGNIILGVNSNPTLNGNWGRNWGSASNAVGTGRAQFDNAYYNNDYQYNWYLGLSTEITAADPLTFALDVVWGTSIDPSDSYLSRNGWYIAGRADYKTPYMTPGLIAWWTSGDDANIYNGSEKLPVIAPTFGATSFGMDGAALIGGAGNVLGASAEGTWGIALQLADISFVEDLTHDLRVAWIGGTNDPMSMRNTRDPGTVAWSPRLANFNRNVLTTADYAWEINFDHRYQIYENLAAVVEMGMVDVQRQAYPWRADTNRMQGGNYDPTDASIWKTSTAWKLAMGLQYRF